MVVVVVLMLDLADHQHRTFQMSQSCIIGIWYSFLLVIIHSSGNNTVRRTTATVTVDAIAGKADV